MTDRGLARLRGVPVTVSYVADPAVGRGEFALDNEGDAPLSAAVVEAWLDRDGHRLPLPGVSLFDLGTEQAVDSADLAVPARSTRRFLVGFPPPPPWACGSGWATASWRRPRRSGWNGASPGANPRAPARRPPGGGRSARPAAWPR